MIATRSFFVYRSDADLPVNPIDLRWGEQEDLVHALILDAQGDLERVGFDVESEVPQEERQALENTLEELDAEAILDEARFSVLLNGKAVVGFTFCDSGDRQYAATFRPLPRLSPYLIGCPPEAASTLPLLRKRP